MVVALGGEAAAGGTGAGASVDAAVRGGGCRCGWGC